MLSVLFAVAFIKLIIFLSCRQIDIVDGQDVLRCSPSYRKNVLIGVYIFPIFIAIFIGTITGFNSNYLGWGYFAFSFPIAGYYIYLTKYYLSINEIGITWREFNKIHNIAFNEITSIHTSIFKEEKKQSYSKLIIRASKKFPFKIDSSEILGYNQSSSTQFRTFDDVVITILRHCKPFNIKVSEFYFTNSD